MQVYAQFMHVYAPCVQVQTLQMSLAELPPSLAKDIEAYLPTGNAELPFVTLTFAQSIDARISAEKGVQTKISHAETKTMTHFLRSKHDSILIGIGTFLADDPGLNNRYDSHMIRPVVLDPSLKILPHWNGSKMQRLATNGDGLFPIVVTTTSIQDEPNDIDIVKVPSMEWHTVLCALKGIGINSVMVEGGGYVINSLLSMASPPVDSLIITIGPVFLGEKGVPVSPAEAKSLKQVKWWKGIQDVVLMAKIL